MRVGNDVSYIGSNYAVIPFAAGFYAAGVLIDNEKARETGVLSGEALLDTLIVVQVLKPIAGRNRPNSVNRAGRFFDGGNSFPSGHSIASWALASVVAHEYGNKKWAPWVAYGLAASVGAARFAARQHYASDVVAGGAMGWFIGAHVYNTHVEHAGHLQASVTPLLQPSNRTCGVAVALSAGK